jgi:hypothetical protein
VPLARVEQALLRHHLLILDEVRFVTFTKLGADLIRVGKIWP